MGEEAKIEAGRRKEFARLLGVRKCGHLCARGADYLGCCRCDDIAEYACGIASCDLPVPEGCTLVEDAPNLLLLDFDGLMGKAHSLTVKSRLKVLGIKAVEIEQWKSRHGNLHMKVTLKEPMPYTDRIKLQRDLGSDRGRYWYDMRRVSGTRRNVLFKPIG